VRAARATARANAATLRPSNGPVTTDTVAGQILV
jgi:hypothetical protein